MLRGCAIERSLQLRQLLLATTKTWPWGTGVRMAARFYD
jgi:hypothetical protein